MNINELKSIAKFCARQYRFSNDGTFYAGSEITSKLKRLTKTEMHIFLSLVTGYVQKPQLMERGRVIIKNGKVYLEH